MAVERGRRLDLALAASRLAGAERAWVHHLTFGVCRLRGRLDHLLDEAVARGIDSLRPDVVVALRMGAFQLSQMGSVPDHAAVSQTVELMRSVAGPGAARLANAVLRSLQRTGFGKDRFPNPDQAPLDYLTTWGSHPRWLVERWLERWSFQDVEALVELNNRRPHLHVRPFDGDTARAVEALRAVGIHASPVGSGTGCVVVEDGTAPTRVLGAVPGFIQDPGAALVTRSADPPAAGVIADLCAAPGGKALGLLAPGRTVLACDASEPRMRLLQQHVRSRNLRGIELLVARVERAPFTAVDAAILDAPCTGTGTLRRHPDARWRLGPERVAKLVRIQRRLLHAAAPLVTSGGLLVYSTCSLEIEENRGQVDWFLAEHPEYSLEATTRVKPDLTDDRGCLAVLPQSTGFDGAFAARFRRRA